MKTYALIMAAGTGERFAADTPKQLRLLVDRPMAAWCIERLSSSPRVSGVLVVCAPGGEDALRTSFTGTVIDRVHAIVDGGPRRQDSVRLGLAALPGDATHVLIHDAARPCLSAELVERLLDALARNDAVVPTAPAVDTLVRDDGAKVDAILDRAHVCAVQTPQAFRVQLIRDAHARAAQNGLSASDDGSLVFAMGETVATVPGERTNIKVTYPEDLVIAEAILRAAAK